ncbi:MAG: hypothetical protein IMY78_00500, partial [Chloroflexi bacterium]|nr:hypothetical protein [Chloroflexota bacterium]
MRKQLGLLAAFVLVVALGLPFLSHTPVLAAELTLRPNGNTNTIGIDYQAPPNKGAHYDKVDDGVADCPFADWVWTRSSTQQRDFYTLHNPGITTGIINSVTVHFWVSTQPSFCNWPCSYFQPYLRLNGVETAGTEIQHHSDFWGIYE